MGAQTLYRPLRDHHDVNHLHVENATSGRRRGADSRGGGFNSISEPRLEYADDDSPASAIMADWPWEPTNTTSPMQQISSPLVQSSSSQSSHEQPRTQDVSTSSMQPPASTRSSLIETLQTCLNSNSSSSPPTPRSLGTPAKPLKRRPRVSRRVPTVTLEATSSEFLGIVQRLTGVSAAQSSAAAAPVRPQPHRAAPVTTFIRPDRLTSALNFSGIDIQQNFSRSQLFAPRRFDGGSSSSTSTFATPPPIVATAPASSLPSWTSTWDSGPSNLISENVSTSGPGNSIVLPDGSEFSLTQFDAWLSGQDDT